MNDDIQIQSNEQEMFKLFDKLKDKISKETTQKALTAGGMALRDAARGRLLKKMPQAATAKGRERNATMIEGIRVSKNKSSDRAAVNVYILGNYLNRWFELGTQERKLKRSLKKDDNHRKFKKGESRGKISGLHFFQEAREADIDKVRAVIFEVIKKEIGKIFDE